MRSSFADFAWGAAGGLIYGLGKGIFGSGIIGALAAPVLAGSVITGARGTALATTAGFLLLSGLGGGSPAKASTSSDAGVM